MSTPYTKPEQRPPIRLRLIAARADVKDPRQKPDVHIKESGRSTIENALEVGSLDRKVSSALEVRRDGLPMTAIG